MLRPIKFIAIILLGAAVCGCSLESDPKLTVTVIVTGIPSREESERIEKSLKDLVKGSIRRTSSTWTGDTLTIDLSPVPSAQELSRQINFGTVIETQGNTIKIAFAKQTRI